jgi:hypothetical protein
VARGRCLWPWVGAEEAGGRLDEDEQQLPEEADSGHYWILSRRSPPGGYSARVKGRSITENPRLLTLEQQDLH